MTRPTPKCPHVHVENYTEQYGHSQVEAIPTFFCKVTEGLCVFNTEDWKPRRHECKRIKTFVLLEEK